MARKRTREEIQKDIKYIKMLTEKPSVDILSERDLSRRLNLSLSQLKYCFSFMEESYVKKIKKQFSMLSKAYTRQETIRFSTDAMLGVNKTHTKAIFIDPASTLNVVLEEGYLHPRKNDILYVCERYNGMLFIRKAIVISAEVNKCTLKVQVVMLCKSEYEESKKIHEILIETPEFNNGVDCYVLSRM
ncbi:MAG TPA: hypothetical protein DCZ30_07170 [Clostridiales bacterium]|nr:hypothetical protein [Clostridiales bacterium]